MHLQLKNDTDRLCVEKKKKDNDWTALRTQGIYRNKRQRKIDYSNQYQQYPQTGKLTKEEEEKRLHWYFKR